MVPKSFCFSRSRFVFGILILLSFDYSCFKSVCFVCCCAKNKNALKKKEKKSFDHRLSELRFDLIPSFARKRRYVGNLDRSGHYFEIRYHFVPNLPRKKVMIKANF